MAPFVEPQHLALSLPIPLHRLTPSISIDRLLLGQSLPLSGQHGYLSSFLGLSMPIWKLELPTAISAEDRSPSRRIGGEASKVPCAPGLFLFPCHSQKAPSQSGRCCHPAHIFAFPFFSVTKTPPIDEHSRGGQSAGRRVDSGADGIDPSVVRFRHGLPRHSVSTVIQVRSRFAASWNTGVSSRAQWLSIDSPACHSQRSPCPPYLCPPPGPKRVPMVSRRCHPGRTSRRAA